MVPVRPVSAGAMLSGSSAKLTIPVEECEMQRIVVRHRAAVTVPGGPHDVVCEDVLVALWRRRRLRQCLVDAKRFSLVHRRVQQIIILHRGLPACPWRFTHNLDHEM